MKVPFNIYLAIIVSCALTGCGMSLVAGNSNSTIQNAQYSDGFPWELNGIQYTTIPSSEYEMIGDENNGSNDDFAIPIEIKSFQISIYEITQQQYKTTVGTNPSYFRGDENLPVERVTWYDAAEFCNLMSERAGLSKCYNEKTWECDFSADGFRLPTELEWEYACRAQSPTKYYNGNTESDLDDAGWYVNNSNGTSHPVGLKIENKWSIYDMHGNVWEWCNDWYSTEKGSIQSYDTNNIVKFRVIRGGSWNDYADICQSDSRGKYTPENWYRGIGFRVVRNTPNE